MNISITDESQALVVTEESFLDDQCFVTSRSGINIAEGFLIEAIARLPDNCRLLVCGNRTGAAAMAAQGLLGAEVVVHTLDCYHQRKVKTNLERNHNTAVTVLCTPDISQTDYFDAALLQVSKGAMSNELMQDILQQIHLAIKPGGKCLTAVDSDHAWQQQQSKKLFGNCSVHAARKNAPALLIATKNKPLKKIKKFDAEFEMTLPDGDTIQLRTVPGVFSHRRVDAGAQALSEVAEVQSGDRILDLGCGCGVVGISLAAKAGDAHVTFVDSHVRAAMVTEHNCKANGLSDYRVLQSDRGLDEKGQFSVFVANPPYFSNHKISELFIRTGYRALQPGGHAWVVAKTAKWHREFMAETFGNAEVIRRRGYEVVKAVKGQQ